MRLGMSAFSVSAKSWPISILLSSMWRENTISLPMLCHLRQFSARLKTRGFFFVFVNNLAADPALHSFQETAKLDDNYQAIVLVLLNGKDPNMLPPGHPAKMFCSIWNQE